MALLAWLANLGSSFKRDVKPPRTVEDVANSVSVSSCIEYSKTMANMK